MIVILRARHSRSLDEYSLDTRPDSPIVSVVVPARNEAHNIERCIRSVLASDYPRLEVIAVDDHSTDATGAILRGIAREDARLRVVVPPPLPDGWFGKQWACSTGAAACSGDVIAFFDADTWQSADLIPRCVNAMRERDADLLTVGGSQELGSFWEKVLQPQVFTMILLQFGGTEAVNDSRHATRKIANGQCIFVRRGPYEALGGHGAVRDKVAEDLALAQLYFRQGRRTVLILGLDQLYTRMYTSLRELIEGWGKNIFAGGRGVMPFGIFGQIIYPFALVAAPLINLVPAVVVALALVGLLGGSWLLWGGIALAGNVLWWLGVYWWLELSPLYALVHPLGAAVLLYIAVKSVIRGRRVRWKGRDYVAT